MYLYLSLALQAYCIYHCYTNKYPYYWILIIFFIPIVGSLAYLFMNVIQKRDVEIVQDGLTAVINPGKKITDLEKKLRFSDTFENRSNLADAYLEAGMYEEAISDYKTCLEGTFQNDFYVISKLAEAYYFSTDFDNALQCAERIKEHTKFKKSEVAFLYALALEKQGKISEAEHYLSQFDAPFSRYRERLELAKFYIRNTKKEKAKELLNEMIIESEGMSKPSFRENKALITKARELLASEVAS